MSADTADATQAKPASLTLDGLFFRLLIVGLLLTCSVSYFPLSIGRSRLHDSFIYWDVVFIFTIVVSSILSWLVYGSVKLRSPMVWAWLPLLALTCWCGFSGLLFAKSPDFFVASITPYVSALLIALFAPSLIVRFRLSSFILDAFLACSFVVSGVALLQCFQSPESIFANITSVLTGNRSHIGLYMLIVLAVGMYRLGDRKSNWRIAATSLAFVCILVSGSRAALLGSLPLITIYFFQKISFANLIKLILGVVAIFLIMTYIVESRKGVDVKGTDVKESQFEVSNDVQIDASAGRRILAWVATWKAIQNSSDVFWRGFGFSNYRWEYGKSIKMLFFFIAAHNANLQLWSETGIIGLGFYLLFFASLVLIGMKQRKRYRSVLLLSALAIGMLVTSVTQETFYPNEGGANLPSFFLLACVTMITHTALKPGKQDLVIPDQR